MTCVFLPQNLPPSVEHPGVSIFKAHVQHKMSLEQAADLLDMTQALAHRIFSGDVKIYRRTAEHIQKAGWEPASKVLKQQALYDLYLNAANLNLEVS